MKLHKFKVSEIGKIPKDWEVVKLKDLCSDISYGYTASAESQTIGPKFLRITDLQSDSINWDSVPYCKITKSDYKKYLLNIGDICIARTGASTGATAIIKKKIDAVFASYLIRFKINRQIADPFFVGYILKSPSWRLFIDSIIGGSAQPGANAQILSSFQMPLPPFPIQRAISKILSELDEKIELNRQMNKTLESIAQAIFKHWFVDFEFPDKNGNPYKSSGGKMVDSELGKIPKGWQVNKVANLVLAKKFAIVDGPFGTQLHSNEYVLDGIPVIRIINLTEDGRFINANLVYITEDKFDTLKRSAVYPGDILLAKTGATIGKLSMVPGYIEKSLIASSIMKITPRQDNRFYLYYIIKRLSSLSYWESISAGSTRATINLSDVKDMLIIGPDAETLNAFEKTMISLYKIIEEHEKQNQNLTQIRDSLLPKLMMGKIRINE